MMGVVVAITVQTSRGDVLVTKNGGRFEGKVTEDGNAYVLVRPGGGKMRFQKAAVKEVIKQELPSPEGAASEDPTGDAATEQAAIKAKRAVDRLLRPVRTRVAGCKSQVSAARAAVRARQKAEVQEFSPEDMKKIKLAEGNLKRIESAIKTLGKRTEHPTPGIRNERVFAVSIEFTAPDGAEKKVLITKKTARRVLRSAQSDVKAATSAAKQNAAKRHEGRHRAELAGYPKLMTVLENVDSMIEAVRDPLAAVVDDQAKSKEILARLETQVDSSLQGVRGTLERLDRGMPASRPPSTPLDAQEEAKSEPWQQDITLFRQAAAGSVQPFALRSQTQIGGAEEKAKAALEPFKGHEVVWQITFQSLEPSGEVKFKEASPAAGKGSFLGKTEDFVNVTIKAAAASRAQWVAVKPATVVGCRGQIADVVVATRWTASKQFAGWMIAVTVEGAVPVSGGATKEGEGNLPAGRQNPAVETPLPASPLWPKATGYVSKPQRRPTSPHPKSTHTDSKRTNAEVTEVREGQLIIKGKVEMVFDGGVARNMLRNPGAHITNALKNRSQITIPDFNGDDCVIPYGMTVRVDEFGQFVPIKYSPEKGK